MSELDKAFHIVASATENIHWHDFREVGLDEPYYDYYYAEDELYVIRDRVYLRLWFCKARSPKEAWQKYEDECRSLAIAWGEDDSADILKDMPSAEPKTGRWKLYPIADGCIQCSVCGILRVGEPSNFCPNCGADMRGEHDE